MQHSVCTSHLHIGHIEKEEQWSNLTANRLLPCYVRNLLSLKETDLPKSLVTSPFSCGKRNLNIKPESIYSTQSDWNIIIMVEIDSLLF